jgi:flagellar P-ring protein FlgI
MRLPVILALLIAQFAWLPAASANGARIKDLVVVEGARDNQLVGYGLVAGLAGDGDKNPIYTVQSIANMLQRFGITVPATTLQSKNVGAVLVTADIPAFIKPGTRLDVQVASLGDAKSLQGGILMQTPLLGADGKVYAVAQGPLSVGGFTAGTGGGGGATVTKNHPTAAQIINGALVEREIPATIVHENSLELLLREPDFTSAARLAAAISAFDGTHPVLRQSPPIRPRSTSTTDTPNAAAAAATDRPPGPPPMTHRSGWSRSAIRARSRKSLPRT